MRERLYACIQKRVYTHGERYIGKKGEGRSAGEREREQERETERELETQMHRRLLAV